MSRILLGRNTGLGIREKVYETADAIEVDTTDQYELSRKRVLFEDIVLVTYHREVGGGYVGAHVLIATVFLFIAAATAAAQGGWLGALIVGAFAVPSIVAILVRTLLQVDVISVYSRRARAKIRFTFRKELAREVYGRICAKARQTQRKIEEENRALEPEPEPLPDAETLPPSVTSPSA